MGSRSVCGCRRVWSRTSANCLFRLAWNALISYSKMLCNGEYGGKCSLKLLKESWGSPLLGSCSSHHEIDSSLVDVNDLHCNSRGASSIFITIKPLAKHLATDVDRRGLSGGLMVNSYLSCSKPISSSILWRRPPRGSTTCPPRTLVGPTDWRPSCFPVDAKLSHELLMVQPIFPCTRINGWSFCVTFDCRFSR